MKTIRYAIWHTARTGSNWLCNLLHHTERAGFHSYPDSGFFVGIGEGLNHLDLKRASDVYFAKMQTNYNGQLVQGTKLSAEYLAELRPKVGKQAVHDLIRSFSHHILLHRRDLIAQAVSAYIAKNEHWYSSAEPRPPKSNLQFDYDEIAWQLAAGRGIHQQNALLLDSYGLAYTSVTYEELVDDSHAALNKVLRWIGVPQVKEAPLATITKQRDERKNGWGARFAREYSQKQRVATLGGWT